MANVIWKMVLENFMRSRWLPATISTLILAAGILGGYIYWFYDNPRAVGPLAQELLERFDPAERDQTLDDVIAAHIAPELSIHDRQSILEVNGFDCVIRPAAVAGNEILSCRRPIEGQRHCVRFNYFAYQAVNGEIIESLASTYRVREKDKFLGLCPYKRPSANG